MSVADILEKIGKWTIATELVKIVVEKMNVIERTAYRKIKSELNEGTIKKIPLPGGNMIYGLSNWSLENIDLKLLLEIWNTHIRDKEATAAEVTAWAKLIEAARGL